MVQLCHSITHVTDTDPAHGQPFGLSPKTVISFTLEQQFSSSHFMHLWPNAKATMIKRTPSQVVPVGLFSIFIRKQGWRFQ
jgi:hypothetical protein